ncbi:MAG: hypothetical protein V3T08_09965 [Gemmatimonadota bacterium]
MTADDLIRWYYRQRDSFGPPPMNFVDSTGRMFVEECKFPLKGKPGEVCGSKVRKMEPDGTWICVNFKCAKPWAFEDCDIFKGVVQKTARIDTFEHRHAKWIDVGTQLHHFMNTREYRTSARVYVAFVMGHTIAKISATHSPRLWFTEPGEAWSERTVYEHKRIGRAEWSRRLWSAGLPFDE